MQLNRCEQSLTLEGKKYSREEIVHLISSVSEVTSPFCSIYIIFLLIGLMTPLL